MSAQDLRQQVLALLATGRWHSANALFNRCDCSDIQPIHGALRQLLRSGQVVRVVSQTGPVYALPETPNTIEAPRFDCFRTYVDDKSPRRAKSRRVSLPLAQPRQPQRRGTR